MILEILKKVKIDIAPWWPSREHQGLGFLCKEQRDSTNAVPKPGLQATADSDDDDDDVQEDLRARMKRVIADKGLETQGVESGVTQFTAHTPSS